MAGGIFSGDDYLAATRQQIGLTKTASRVAVAGSSFSVFDLAGSPGSGVLAAGNTAAGIVPVDTDVGYPLINNFAAGAVGMLTGIDFASSVACRITLFDRLFVAGEYNFNDNIVLAAQPSFAGRVPGADYKATELWIEPTTPFTGIPTITCTYTSDEGTAAKSTGAVIAPAALTLGRCQRMPLAAGDEGLQKLESISTAGTAATAGKFNAMILRRLGSWRVNIANFGESRELLGMKPRRIYQNSALYVLITPDSTATGVLDLEIEVSSY